MAIMQESDDNVGGGLAVLVPVKSDVSNLVGDGDLFHAPRHEVHIALGGNDQHVRREVSPMIQTRKVVDVLRRGNEAEIEVVGGHALPQLVQSRLILLLREIEAACGHETHLQPEKITESSEPTKKM